MVGIGFCMLSMCLLLSCTNHWGGWVDLCVNKWSGINHRHPRVTMHVGSTCAWRAWRDRSGCIRVFNRHRRQQHFWTCQSVVYSDWCALTWKLTFTFITRWYVFVCQLWSCWVPIGVGALTLIRKHTLQLVVWRCHSAYPHLLIDHTHPITKICCMCLCGWFTSSRFGHIRYQLVLVHWHR